MVVASLALGGTVGVLLSAGFLWWEVGRYAAPQVPVSRFDERKVLSAYTVGLFVGVPLAVSLVLFLAAAANGALPGAVLFLGLLVLGGELSQYLLTRSVYWGAGVARPFYAVSLRAGVGGILALAVVASYLGSTGWPSVVGVLTALLTALALVVLEVSAGLLAYRDVRPEAARIGGPWPAALFEVVAFFLLALGYDAGVAGRLLGPAVVILGGALAYRGRRAILGSVPAPPEPLRSDGSAPPAYGRTGAPEAPTAGRPPPGA